MDSVEFINFYLNIIFSIPHFLHSNSVVLECFHYVRDMHLRLPTIMLFHTHCMTYDITTAYKQA